MYCSTVFDFLLFPVLIIQGGPESLGSENKLTDDLEQCTVLLLFFFFFNLKASWLPASLIQTVTDQHISRAYT